MRRGIVAFLSLTLAGLALTGCGMFRAEQREPWRAEAEQACLKQKLVQASAYVAQAPRIDGPGSCGMDYPFKVAAFSGGSVALNTRATLACPMVATVDAWLDEIVKPAAQLYFGASVVDLRAGSYSCRPRNNQRGAKVSEHAYGNAVDVMAFQLADGRVVNVEKGWRGDPVEQEFLREVFVGACRYFTTVLAPGSDMFHYNHIHIDLARHDPRGQRRICKPLLKFAPRIEPGRPVAQGQPADLAPIDLEEDGEPGPQAALPPPMPAYRGEQTYRAPAPASPSVPPPGRGPTILNGNVIY